MSNAKMTRKEMFELIAETMSDNQEVVEMCGKYIAQLSKPRKTKAAIAADEFAAAIGTWMAENPGPHTNKEIATTFEVSGQKVTGALRKLREMGAVTMIAPEKSTGVKTYEIVLAA